MKAKITKDPGFFCAPEGHTTIFLPVGKEVDGKAAEMAVAANAAEVIPDVPEPAKETKDSKAPETKPGKKD